MAFKLAEAYVQLSSRGFGGVSAVIDQTAGKFTNMGSSIAAVAAAIPGVGQLIAALGVGAGVIGMIKSAAAAEQTAISFEVLLGSASAAKKMLDELNEFAAATPFDFPGLSNAAKMLLSFGVDAGSVMDDVRLLSDIAQGDAQKLGSLALVFGQISSAGRLTGQDLLQLVNAGFNPLQIISEQTGESMASLRDKMSDGLISFDMVRNAFKAATSEGGRFYKMNEKQSQTLSGLWSTLSDTVGMGLRDLGQTIIDAFNLKGALSISIAGLEAFGTVAMPIIRNVGGSIRFVLDTLGSVAATVISGLSQISSAFGLDVLFNRAYAAGVQILDVAVNLFESVFPSAVAVVTAVQSAFGNFWEGLLMSAQSASESISSLWQSFGGGGAIMDIMISGMNAVSESIIYVMDTLAFMITNWDLMWDLANAYTALAISNMFERVRTFGINAVEIISWFGDNWYSILFTAADAIFTIFINLGQNIRGLWQEIMDYVMSFGEDPIDMTAFNRGLLDGFRSTIGQMPQLTEAAIMETNDIIEGLQSDLNQRAEQQGFGSRREPANFREQVAKAFEAEDRTGNKKDVAASSSGKAGQIVSLSQLANNIQTAALKKAEQFAQQTAEATQKIAGAVGPDGKVKTSAGPAIAG